MRGGEKVLESLCRIFPAADIFTLFYRRERISEGINSHRIVASRLNRLPGSARYYRYLLPLMPAAIESFDLRGYDLVVSSSHAVAKGARVPQGVPHICYCHTPMRYLWAGSRDYFQAGWMNRLKRPALAAFANRLREWDVHSSQRVTQFIANSENVRGRIREAYGRDSKVLYPPVNSDFFTPHESTRTGDYYLIVSALEPYKRIDLAIRTMQRLGRRLIIAGRGTQLGMLRRLSQAGSVEFLGWVSDERLRELYRGCRALLFPGLEDFGMTPVEAQACGRPVIAYGRGGALESVVDGVTGVFFPEQSEESLTQAVETFERMSFDPDAARRSSLRFSSDKFETGIRTLLPVVTR